MSFPGLPVDGIHPGGTDADENLGGQWHGPGERLDGEHLATTETVLDDRTHGVDLFGHASSLARLENTRQWLEGHRA
ncbi:hypothetical protein GCM10023320_57950 [Pseudonocardia adelaidensis]|uniref:Uncharacterized protein n=1 Tax=Pseudonocardia adelaidensis TaxID=648754 RepID=A0ABP9NX02_9PSEU